MYFVVPETGIQSEVLCTGQTEKYLAQACDLGEVCPSDSAVSMSVSAEEVAKHNKDSDCWVIVGDQVLDVTNFLSANLRKTCMIGLRYKIRQAGSHIMKDTMTQLKSFEVTLLT